MQEQLDSWGVWPGCVEHDVGLHSEIRDGKAVWYCRLGKHTGALIGKLSPDDVS
jgi:hypothetical protein